MRNSVIRDASKPQNFTEYPQSPGQSFSVRKHPGAKTLPELGILRVRFLWGQDE